MYLTLTDDQSMLRDTTVRFIETELPLPRTRELHDDPIGYDPKWLRRAADIGWFAMLVPEEAGGGSVSGQGLIDATLVAEAVGRHVQPGPFVPMNVVAATLAEHGPTEALAGIVAGQALATWAPTGHVHARRANDGITLSGTSTFVQHAQSAEWLLVCVTLDDQPAQVLVPAGLEGVRVRPLTCLDLSRRMAHVDFDDVHVRSPSVLTDPDTTERQLQRAVVLNSAETVGALDAMFTMSVEYSKDRIAFGRPIGSFQALKHVMADLAVELETCKAAAVEAAEAVQRGDADAAEVVSMTAAYIGDVGNNLAQECLQIHGGIGYTWEHDLHLLMRRVRSNSALYGEPTWHRERVCAFHRL